MAARRAIIAAGSASAAAVACSSQTQEAECAGSTLTSSFDFISQAELDDTAKLIFQQGGAPSAEGSTSDLHSSLELCEIGNGWLTAGPSEAVNAAVALGRDLAGDPRVQAAVIDRMKDPRALGSPAHLLDELKLVLVSREVAADDGGTDSTAPSDAEKEKIDAGVQASFVHVGADSDTRPAEDRAKDAGDVASVDESATTAEPDQEDVHAQAAGYADEEGPSIASVLVEAAIVVASVLIITILARRFNAKACSLAAAAIAGAWGSIFASKKG